MKKLMVAVAAVATAFGLYADGLKNTTGFEALAEGSTLDITKADDGTDPGEGSGPLWYAAGENPETGTITAYGETAAKYDYGTQERLVTDGPGNQFLALDSSETIYRTAVEVKGDKPTTQAIGDGAFFDTLVKFTATEGLAVPQLDAGAKVAIWAGYDDAADDAPTNLFVTAAAGATGLACTPANFTIDVGDDFDFAAWHRVTLRAIGEINTDVAKIAGFTLFIDGKQVACSDEDYAEKLGTGLTLKSEAAKFAAAQQLFVSMATGNEAQTFVGMGFKGNGSVDDVAITDKANAPAFAKGSKMFTIAWTDGVTGFTLTDSAGKVVTTKSGLEGADSEILTIDTAITSFTVSDVTHAADYTLDPLTFNGDEIKGNVFTLVGEADAGSINASIKYFEVNGKQYASIADAFAAAAGETVSLIKDYAMGEDDTEIEIDDAVVFDLQGNELTLGDDYADDDIFLVNAGAALTIIDSVGGGAIDGTGLEYIIYSDGDVNIGLDIGDEGATFTGVLLDGNPPVIVKGNFDKANNGEDEFAYGIDEDHEVVDTVIDDYWTVRAKQAENFVIEIVGGKQYETIDAALADAQNGDELKLLKDVAEKMVVPAGLTITLDMNGKTLQNAVSGYTIDNAGNLTVVDNADTKGTITHLTADTSSTIRNLGTLVISDITVGGTYIGVKNDEGVGCNGDKGYGELTLNGVTYNGDDQAVQNWGKATLNGGTFGGAVFTWASNANKGNVAGETTILGGTFNAAVASVNTYYNDTWPTKDALVTIKGGTFNGKVYGTYTTNYQGEEPVRGKIVVVGEIAEETINPAQFTYDASDYCEEGYETVKLESADYYTVQKKAKVVKPGEPVGLSNGGEMTEEEAQAAAEKIPVVIEQADIDAGLTTEAVTVKAEFIGGAWMAVLEPKTAPIVDETMAISVDEDTFSATVKNPVPGVYYGFVATDTLGTAFKPVGEYVRAKEGDVKIGLDAPKGGDACFYKLNAALRPPKMD